MATMTYREALKAAMSEEMERDDSVVLLGEDIGVYGGTHLITDGLIDRFGAKRVIYTPIAENGFTGAAIGMVRTHARPMFFATPHRTADSRFVAPTPMIDEVMVWVVETGTSYTNAVV